MKKVVAVLLAMMLLLCNVSALASEMGVQVIGGPEVETEAVSLDDFKLNAIATIDGYGKLTGTSFEIVTQLGYYRQGRNSVYYASDDYYRSGKEAQFVLLRMDILNTSVTSRDFLSKCVVKAVYDEVYEYGGWFYQCNYDNQTYNDGPDAKNQNTKWSINASDNFAINPMYTGHFIFGCTLPNAIFDSKAPLKLIITLDDNEITYNIRK